MRTPRRLWGYNGQESSNNSQKSTYPSVVSVIRAAGNKLVRGGVLDRCGGSTTDKPKTSNEESNNLSSEEHVFDAETAAE